MEDVELPHVAQTYGPDWHFFGNRPPADRPMNDPQYENNAYYGSNKDAGPRLVVRDVTPAYSEPVAQQDPVVKYAEYVPAQSIPAQTVSTSTRFAGTSPGVPVFVLKTGMVLAVGNYSYQDGRISYELASGGSGVISSDEVDWTTTTQVNLQRGVRVSLPTGRASAGTAGN
jgi:hypothetical protein